MDVVTAIEALPVGRFHRLHLLRQQLAWSVFAMSRMRSLLSTASPSLLSTALPRLLSTVGACAVPGCRCLTHPNPNPNPNPYPNPNPNGLQRK